MTQIIPEFLQKETSELLDDRKQSLHSLDLHHTPLVIVQSQQRIQQRQPTILQHFLVIFVRFLGWRTGRSYHQLLDFSNYLKLGLSREMGEKGYFGYLEEIFILVIEMEIFCVILLLVRCYRLLILLSLDICIL